VTDRQGYPDVAGPPVTCLEMSDLLTGTDASRQSEQRTEHRCPGRCGRVVPNHLYVCGPCWRKLPGELQRAVRATICDPVLSPARTRTFAAAAAFYTALAADSDGTVT
jgi:hypothetical protein